MDGLFLALSISFNKAKFPYGMVFSVFSIFIHKAKFPLIGMVLFCPLVHIYPIRTKFPLNSGWVLRFRSPFNPITYHVTRSNGVTQKRFPLKLRVRSGFTFSRYGVFNSGNVRFPPEF